GGDPADGGPGGHPGRSLFRCLGLGGFAGSKTARFRQKSGLYGSGYRRAVSIYGCVLPLMAMDRSLIVQILREIKADPQQRISFRRYMELALYHPHLGYYRRPLPKIGKERDFYTSPKVGEVFGWSLAQAMARMVDTFPPDTPWLLIEAGAGDGTLAQQVIQSLAEQEQLPAAFYLIESSHYHRTQLEELAGRCPVPLRLVNGVAEIPDGKPAILYSNELLDAFPVHRVTSDQGALRELYVAQ